MRFMVLMIPNVYQGPNVDPNIRPDPAMLEKMGAFNEELVKAGMMLAGEGLHPRAKGARISFVTGKPQVIAGPQIESKDVLGGFWMLKANSQQEVIEWMTRCPAQKGDILEIRQVFEAEDFET
jgi:hypothetical protein